MPIYRQTNELEGPKTERGDLFYNNDDPRQCTETVIVLLGGGDIAISTAERRTPGVLDEIIFVDTREPNVVGETSDKFNGVPTHPPVALVFDRRASVDILIKQLEKLKETIPNA